MAEWATMEKNMKSPPRLDLGTINIAPFIEGLILLPEHVSGV